MCTLQTAPFVAATLTHLSRHHTCIATTTHVPSSLTRTRITHTHLTRTTIHPHPTHPGPTGHRQIRPLQVSEGDGRVRQVHGKQVERERATVVPSRPGVSHRGQVQGRQRMTQLTATSTLFAKVWLVFLVFAFSRLMMATPPPPDLPTQCPPPSLLPPHRPPRAQKRSACCPTSQY